MLNDPLPLIEKGKYLELDRKPVWLRKKQSYKISNQYNHKYNENPYDSIGWYEEIIMEDRDKSKDIMNNNTSRITSNTTATNNSNNQNSEIENIKQQHQCVYNKIDKCCSICGIILDKDYYNWYIIYNLNIIYPGHIINKHDILGINTQYIQKPKNIEEMKDYLCYIMGHNSNTNNANMNITMNMNCNTINSCNKNTIILNDSNFVNNNSINDNYRRKGKIPGGIRHMLTKRSIKCINDEEILKFDSNFESGNLLKINYVKPYEYDLYLNIDTNNNVHGGLSQWFYYSIIIDQVSMKKIIFNIKNCHKRDSLFNSGMKIMMYSYKENEIYKGKGWEEVGDNITYIKNNLKAEITINNYMQSVSNNTNNGIDTANSDCDNTNISYTMINENMFNQEKSIINPLASVNTSDNANSTKETPINTPNNNTLNPTNKDSTSSTLETHTSNMNSTVAIKKNTINPIANNQHNSNNTKNDKIQVNNTIQQQQQQQQLCIRKKKVSLYTLTFSHTFKHEYDKVLFAYTIPYTFTDLIHFLKNIESILKSHTKLSNHNIHGPSNHTNHGISSHNNNHSSSSSHNNNNNHNSSNHNNPNSHHITTHSNSSNHTYPNPSTHIRTHTTPINDNEDPCQFDTIIIKTTEIFYKREKICNTLAGLPLYMITITSNIEDTKKNREARIKYRKGIFITARVHPGEPNSSFVMQGILKYLISNTEEAKRLRNFFVFKLIPMINPDGVAFGNTRTSLSGYDLNRRWQDPNEKLHPTIFFAKQMLKKFKTEREILVFCDLHGHSTKKNAFIYGCNTAADGGFCSWTKVRLFPRIFARRSHMFNYNDCSFRITPDRYGTARVVVWKEFKVTNSFTLETSFFGFDYGDTVQRFGPENLEKLGIDFLLSLLEYIFVLVELNKELYITGGWLKPSKLIEITGKPASELLALKLKAEKEEERKRLRLERLALENNELYSKKKTKSTGASNNTNDSIHYHPSHLLPSHNIISKKSILKSPDNNTHINTNIIQEEKTSNLFKKANTMPGIEEKAEIKKVYGKSQAKQQTKDNVMMMMMIGNHDLKLMKNEEITQKRQALEQDNQDNSETSKKASGESTEKLSNINEEINEHSSTQIKPQQDNYPPTTTITSLPIPEVEEIKFMQSLTCKNPAGKDLLPGLKSDWREYFDVNELEKNYDMILKGEDPNELEQNLSNSSESDGDDAEDQQELDNNNSNIDEQKQQHQISKSNINIQDDHKDNMQKFILKKRIPADHDDLPMSKLRKIASLSHEDYERLSNPYYEMKDDSDCDTLNLTNTQEKYIDYLKKPKYRPIDDIFTSLQRKGFNIGDNNNNRDYSMNAMMDIKHALNSKWDNLRYQWNQINQDQTQLYSKINQHDSILKSLPKSKIAPLKKPQNMLVNTSLTQNHYENHLNHRENNLSHREKPRHVKALTLQDTIILTQNHSKILESLTGNTSLYETNIEKIENYLKSNKKEKGKSTDRDRITKDLGWISPLEARLKTYKQNEMLRAAKVMNQGAGPTSATGAGNSGFQTVNHKRLSIIPMINPIDNIKSHINPNSNTNNNNKDHHITKDTNSSNNNNSFRNHSKELIDKEYSQLIDLECEFSITNSTGFEDNYAPKRKLSPILPMMPNKREAKNKRKIKAKHLKPIGLYIDINNNNPEKNKYFESKILEKLNSNMMLPKKNHKSLHEF